jgi:hypothetical protein
MPITKRYIAMHSAIAKQVRQTEEVIRMEGARWLVWPEEETSFIRGAMSSAQFVHMNAPVIAVQEGDGMIYLDENGEQGWSSNLAWPRTNLEMARLADVVDENETGN